MIKLPIRYRHFGDETLITSEGGDFAFVERDFIPRFIQDNLTVDEIELAYSKRFVSGSIEDWRSKSLALQLRNKFSKKVREFSYFMIVPTLRCNLACSYCQVSRAAEDAAGFDWSDRHLEAFETFFRRYAAKKVKIEFQGGDISLRPDLIIAVENIANKYCEEIELVACTNLFRISEEFESLFGKPNFFLSTSLDGNVGEMSANRTKDKGAAEVNFENIRRVIRDYGIDKISFLPTITEHNYDAPQKLIRLYKELGASGIFLRPVNYQGFARKTHKKLASEFDYWIPFFEKALEEIKILNRESYFEEVYVADLLRTIFLNADSSFVDFRSPSHFLTDLAIVDFDGTIYPTDEARMLTRSKHIDLSVGSIFTGLDEEKIATLNGAALKETHADCVHCAYQPFCGIDVIDDLSRYGRVDLRKSDTWFCNKQTFFFDWIFEKVHKRDAEWLSVFSKWTYRDANPTDNVDALIA